MKSVVACAVLFALLAGSACAAVQDWGYPEEDDVIVLTDSIFDEVVAKHDFIMVEFYAPWCGHCKKLAPEYSKAAKTLKAQEQAVPLAKVDATVETGLAGRFEIQGFPTVKFFIKGKDIEYTGGRTDSEIVAWVNKKSGPTSQLISTAEALEAFKKQNKVGVVFFGDSSSPQYQAYLTVSAAFEDVAFAHSHEEAVRQADGAEQNTAVVYKQFDEGRVVFQGDISSGSLVQFVRDNQYPVVLEIEQSNAQKVFGERRDVLILFVSSTSDPAVDLLRATESQLKGKILLTYTTFNDFGKRVADYIGVSSSEAPTARILKQSTGEMIKYKPSAAEVTTESLVSFFNDVTSGAIEPFYKSEEIPATNDEPVKVVVSKQWKELVEDPTKDVLVEFYAPWCGHCKALAPIYDSLAAKLSGVSNLVIAKMDATANEVAGQSIQGFPTLRFFPTNNKKRPIEFKGDRTEEGIINFLKEHAT